MVMSQYLRKGKTPMISVVIPTYNEEKDIGDLLESLTKQKFKNFEVIIVDNYSNDRTIEIVSRFKGRLNMRIYKIKSNVSKARNFGAEKSRGKIIVFLDADNIVKEDYLFNIYKSFEPDAVCSAYYGWKKTIFNKLHKEGISDIPFAIKRDKFLKVKFDESLSAFEDYDFAKRLDELGYVKVANRKCLVFHKNPDKIYTLFKQQKKWGEEYYRYLKYHNEKTPPFLLPFLFFLIFIKKLAFAYGYLSAGIRDIINLRRNSKYAKKTSFDN